jgi:alkylation response protein AidB-like acyl-CoA dehydrogenase
VNFDLTDEQKALRDAARDALTRHDLLGVAHEVLDGGTPADLWPTAQAAGWPALMLPETHGGVGLGALEALLVAVETGRVLAGIPLMGHTCGCSLLAASTASVGARLEGFAEGHERVALVGAMPPSDLDPRWTVDAAAGPVRADTPVATLADDGAVVSGVVWWVPDVVSADAVVVVALAGDRPVAVLVDPGAEGVTVHDVARYDVTRNLGRVSFDEAPGILLEKVGEEEIRAAWFLGQAWLAAEAVGSVETALETAIAYAKERFTFGRPIGSYQAIKHGLVEIFRQLENARSLVYYAGWSYHAAPEEFALAASAARSAGDHALEHGARELMHVHGGISVTWEHDAPLYYRRAQLTRRLLGGTQASTDRVAAQILVQAMATR